jgi:hypothetical protein
MIAVRGLVNRHARDGKGREIAFMSDWVSGVYKSEYENTLRASVLGVGEFSYPFRLIALWEVRLTIRYHHHIIFHYHDQRFSGVQVL